jgi:hypothetical protein
MSSYDRLRSATIYDNKSTRIDDDNDVDGDNDDDDDDDGGG